MSRPKGSKNKPKLPAQVVATPPQQQSSEDIVIRDTSEQASGPKKIRLGSSHKPSIAAATSTVVVPKVLESPSIAQAEVPKRKGRPPGTKNKYKQSTSLVADQIIDTSPQPTVNAIGNIVWPMGIAIQQKPELRIPGVLIAWTGITIGQADGSRFVRVAWDDGSEQYVPAVCIEKLDIKLQRRRKARLLAKRRRKQTS